MAWYKAEKRRGFALDFDCDGWQETDGDLNEEDPNSLLYEMSTEEMRQIRGGGHSPFTLRNICWRQGYGNLSYP